MGACLRPLPAALSLVVVVRRGPPRRLLLCRLLPTLLGAGPVGEQYGRRASFRRRRRAPRLPAKLTLDLVLEATTPRGVAGAVLPPVVLLPPPTMLGTGQE